MILKLLGDAKCKSSGTSSFSTVNDLLWIPEIKEKDNYISKALHSQQVNNYSQISEMVNSIPVQNSYQPDGILFCPKNDNHFIGETRNVCSIRSISHMPTVDNWLLMFQCCNHDANLSSIIKLESNENRYLLN